ncbi:MAG: hypothetical protein AB7E77_11740 [Desulfobulbus sp.]
MAESEQLTQQHHKQQRLALSALLAHRPRKTGTCLEVETLAALVEGRLEQAEVDRCLAHLAACDRCSTLWLQLDRQRQGLRQEQRRAKIHRLLSRPKILTAVGSLLAAAASVAVFLTITTRMDKSQLLHAPLHQAQTFETRLPEPSRRERTMPESAPAPETTGGHGQQAKEKTGPVAGSAALLAPKNDLLRREFSPLETDKEQKKAAPDASRPPKPPATDSATGSLTLEKESAAPTADQAPLPESTLRTTLQAAAPSPATKAGATPPDLDTWKESLRHGCEQPEANLPAEFALQGRQLLAAGPLDGPQQALVGAILDQLAGNTPPDQQCRRILELLDREKPKEKKP